MTEINAFQAVGNTVSVSATTSTGNVALTSVGSISGTVRIYNAGSVAAFVNLGTSSAVEAAAATSIPIPPGGVLVLTKPATITHAAAITASSTATVYFTSGLGGV